MGNKEQTSYIVEVAPAKPASNGKPAYGPEYRQVEFMDCSSDKFSRLAK